MDKKNEKTGPGRDHKTLQQDKVSTISKPRKKLWRGLKRYGKIVLFSLLLILALDTFGLHGIWIMILMWIPLALWRLWKVRLSFMMGIRSLETILWGKPMDRDMWNKGEFKNRKMAKIVWRRKP